MTARGLADPVDRADRDPEDRADRMDPVDPGDTTRDPRLADRVDPGGRVARRLGTTIRPGGHRRPIRAGAASKTAGAITRRSTTTGAG
jgi:hypothetical protein